MKKYLIIIMIVLILTINVNGSFIKESDYRYIVKSKGNILYVGGSGAGNYTTIQSAIDDALDGDTVFVYDDSSPYQEHVTIDKSISLIGKDKNTTVIEDENFPILINSDDVIVSEFTLIFSETGIVINLSNNIIISKNIFKAQDNYFSYAIEIINSDNNLITENVIISSEVNFYDFVDISLTGDGNIISNNTLIEIGNRENYAIEFSGSNNFIENNSISGYYTGIFFSGDMNIIDNNYITDCDDGIKIYNTFSSENTIKNNKLRNISGDSIDIIRGLKNNIYNNDIRDCDDGIVICAFSWYNAISNNNFINCDRMGYFVRFCFQNTWDGNYWDGPQESPYIVKGRIGLFIPWFNYDYYPAQEPYDI